MAETTLTRSTGKPDGDVQIAVFLTLTEQQIQDGWGGDFGELEGSIKATLHEVIGDDGVPYVPKVYGIEVD